MYLMMFSLSSQNWKIDRPAWEVGYRRCSRCKAPTGSHMETRNGCQDVRRLVGQILVSRVDVDSGQLTAMHRKKSVT